MNHEINAIYCHMVCCMDPGYLRGARNLTLSQLYCLDFDLQMYTHFRTSPEVIIQIHLYAMDRFSGFRFICLPLEYSVETRRKA